MIRFSRLVPNPKRELKPRVRTAVRPWRRMAAQGADRRGAGASPSSSRKAGGNAPPRPPSKTRSNRPVRCPWNAVRAVLAVEPPWARSVATLDDPPLAIEPPGPPSHTERDRPAQAGNAEKMPTCAVRDWNFLDTHELPNRGRPVSFPDPAPFKIDTRVKGLRRSASQGCSPERFRFWA